MNRMEEEFVPYELAVRLKAIGFSSPYSIGGYQGGAVFYYENGKLYYDGRPLHSSDYHEGQIDAPTFQQAFSWFRKEHTMRHNIMDFIDDETGVEWDYEIATIGVDLDENGKYQALVEYSIDDTTRKFKTYEEVQTACLTNLIQIVETKSK